MTLEETHGNIYPFNAIVGQEEAKTVLILNAIDPTIGGALISGPKGSGKSLLVKAFAEILPTTKYVFGCPFRCNPTDPTNMCISCREKSSIGEIKVVDDRVKMVQVPLSVTEDMLVGSLDMEKAVNQGVKGLAPGLLAEANQGFLYIDEVNLLPDHITDSILDAAASGWNIVEREGISVQHPSRFILVGTMNPEEGGLRPQILDRFGIFAETTNLQDSEDRALVIERNEMFMRDPEAFREGFREQLDDLRDKVQKARENLSAVVIASEFYPLVAETCSRLKVDGFRPDIVTVKVSRALAAFRSRDQVLREDVEAALELTLGHRTRESGLAPPPLKKDIRRALKRSGLRQSIGVGLDVSELGKTVMVNVEYLKRLMRKSFILNLLKIISMVAILVSSITLLEFVRFNYTGSSSGFYGLLFEFIFLLSVLLILDRLLSRFRRPEKQTILGILDQDMEIKTSGRLQDRDHVPGSLGGGGLSSKVSYIGEDTSELGIGPKIMSSLDSLHKRSVAIRKKGFNRSKSGGSSSGRGTRVVSRSTRGRYAWYRIPSGRPKDVAFVPTIKTAASKQLERGRLKRTIIEPEDIREKAREYSAPYSIVLLVDMSLSMIESVSNIVQSIYDFHGEVYRRRDRVGLVVFKGSKAYTLQHPTRNLDLVVKKLREVGASDFTPLPAGIFEAWKTLKQEKLRNKDSILHLYVISDGIVNVPLDIPLSPLTRRRYSSEAQADTFDVARLLVKEDIRVHIVNTNHNPYEEDYVIEEDSRIKLKPTQFLKELARISKGEYIGLRQ